MSIGLGGRWGTTERERHCWFMNTGHQVPCPDLRVEISEWIGLVGRLVWKEGAPGSGRALAGRRDERLRIGLILVSRYQTNVLCN